MNAVASRAASRGLATLIRLQAPLTRLLSRLADPFAFATRLYVAWQFFKSGQLKLADWESTLFLFAEEYRVPVLSPELAAVAGTAGELLFPALLALGLFSRVAALGVGAVNVMAVVSYAHVLLGEGFEAALGQHYLWGFMLLMLAVYGPGRWSADHLFTRRCRCSVRAGKVRFEGQ